MSRSAGSKRNPEGEHLGRHQPPRRQLDLRLEMGDYLPVAQRAGELCLQPPRHVAGISRHAVGIQRHSSLLPQVTRDPACTHRN